MPSASPDFQHGMTHPAVNVSTTSLIPLSFLKNNHVKKITLLTRKFQQSPVSFFVRDEASVSGRVYFYESLNEKDLLKLWLSWNLSNHVIRIENRDIALLWMLQSL